jgi:thiol:disulfide interchange protein DsbC
LSEIKNLKVYTFLYPILGNESIEISKDVWCSSDPSSVWDKLMLRGERPKKSSDLNCDFDQQKEVVALGRKLGIQATPTVFLSNGERLRGAIPLEALKDKLQTISGQER